MAAACSLVPALRPVLLSSNVSHGEHAFGKVTSGKEAPGWSFNESVEWSSLNEAMAKFAQYSS